MEDKNEEIWDVEHKDEETEKCERNDRRKCSTWEVKFLIVDTSERENKRRKIPGAEERYVFRLKGFYWL